MIGERVAFGLVITLMAIFFVDVCDLVFGCGCEPLWAGVAAQCNIHAASAPHCPWCEHPLAGGGVAFAAACLASGAAFFRPTHLSLWMRSALALMTSLVGAGVVGLAQGLLWGYWR